MSTLNLLHLPTGIRASVSCNDPLPLDEIQIRRCISNICSSGIHCPEQIDNTVCVLCPWSKFTNPKSVDEFFIEET